MDVSINPGCSWTRDSDTALGSSPGSEPGWQADCLHQPAYWSLPLLLIFFLAQHMKCTACFSPPFLVVPGGLVDTLSRPRHKDPGWLLWSFTHLSCMVPGGGVHAFSLPEL